VPLSVDQARRLPHLRVVDQARVFQAEYARAVAAGVDVTAPRARRNQGVMVDPLELRGLPVVARGVGGVAPGTDPLRALLTKERRRRS
jgi:hypothetical protein